jgi:intraflagellar transport protein 80
VITSIKWAPNGEYFCVGSYNTLRLCNKGGWTNSFNKLESGGIMDISWSNDSTSLTCATGSSYIVTAEIVDRSVQWQNYEVKYDENNKLIVTDFFNSTFEEIDFKDKLVDLKIGYNYIIVATSIQCHIYSLEVS